MTTKLWPPGPELNGQAKKQVKGKQTCLGGCGCLAAFIIFLILLGLYKPKDKTENPTSSGPDIQAVVKPLSVREKKERDQKRKTEAAQRRKDFLELRRQAKITAEFNRTHYDSGGLILDEKSIHWSEDSSGFASYITGKVTNATGHSLDYAEISYKELDGEGNQVGTATDNVVHLSSGATWKFKCVVLEETTKRIQFDQLKSTPF